MFPNSVLELCFLLLVGLAIGLNLFWNKELLVKKFVRRVGPDDKS